MLLHDSFPLSNPERKGTQRSSSAAIAESAARLLCDVYYAAVIVISGLNNEASVQDGGRNCTAR